MKIIFYDGQCGLCGRSVAFIKKRVSPGVFCYQAIQSKEGQRFLKNKTAGADLNPNTFYYWDGSNLFQRSEAACRVGLQLKNPFYQLISRCLLWLPGTIRDGAYNFIARRRRHIGGSCALE